MSTARPPPPPAPDAPLLRALELLAAGDWRGAHAIVQRFDESDARAAWLHAACHKAEGDRANAGYWYARCAGVCGPTSRDDAPAAELADIRRLLLQATPAQQAAR